MKSSPKITKVVRGKYAQLISPSDGAILQISDDSTIKVVGFDEEAKTTGEQELTEPEGLADAPESDRPGGDEAEGVDEEFSFTGWLFGDRDDNEETGEES